jgi:hypothetical protein
VSDNQEQLENNDGEISHLDKLGDYMASQGVKPGCIFEFHFSIHPESYDGGIVITSLPEGERPQSYKDIDKVAVMSKIGGIEVMPPSRMCVVVNLLRRLDELV